MAESIEVTRGYAWSTAVRRFSDKEKTNPIAFEDGVLSAEFRWKKDPTSTELGVLTIDETDRDDGVIRLMMTDEVTTAIGGGYISGWIDVKRTVAGQDNIAAKPFKVTIVDGVTA